MEVDWEELKNWGIRREDECDQNIMYINTKINKNSTYIFIYNLSS